MVRHVHVLWLAGQHVGLALLDELEALNTIPPSYALHANARLRGIGEQLLAITEIDLGHAQAICPRTISHDHDTLYGLLVGLQIGSSAAA